MRLFNSVAEYICYIANADAATPRVPDSEIDCGDQSGSIDRFITCLGGKAMCQVSECKFVEVVGGMGLEPMTIRLKVECSTS